MAKYRYKYEGNRRVKVKVDPKRSKAAKKAAAKRRGKPLSPAHRKAISRGLARSKRRRKT
jgi:hypothetical protein